MPGQGVFLRCPDCADHERLAGGPFMVTVDSTDQLADYREGQAELAEEDGDDMKRIRPEEDKCNNCGAEIRS